MRKKIGLIVNPIAGMGGKVGLKGTDGEDILLKAISLGAKPESPKRVIEALKQMTALKADVDILTCPGDMGENEAKACGFNTFLVEDTVSKKTTAQNTERAVKKMIEAGVDLLIFAGGDGTARNIYNAAKDKLTVLGIPAGVKIHSAVFATSPRNAGELSVLYMMKKSAGVREAEVMDIDEDAIRDQRVVSRLYGYLRVPYQRKMVQNLKAGQAKNEDDIINSIALAVVNKMKDDCLYIIGPGTTTRAVMKRLGLKNSLIGVDVVKNRSLIANDVNEAQLLNLSKDNKLKIIVTVIGGQGYVFGRGNQQISPAIIRKAGKENIMIIAAASKIIALSEKTLLVDTGDDETNRMMAGYIKVKTGTKENMICRIDAG